MAHFGIGVWQLTKGGPEIVWAAPVCLHAVHAIWMVYQFRDNKSKLLLDGLENRRFFKFPLFPWFIFRVIGDLSTIATTIIFMIRVIMGKDDGGELILAQVLSWVTIAVLEFLRKWLFLRFNTEWWLVFRYILDSVRGGLEVTRRRYKWWRLGRQLAGEEIITSRTDPNLPLVESGQETITRPRTVCLRS